MAVARRARCLMAACWRTTMFATMTGMLCGINGFRWWTWPKGKVSKGFAPCGCGYAGLPHLAAKRHAETYKCETRAQIRTADRMDDERLLAQTKRPPSFCATTAASMFSQSATGTWRTHQSGKMSLASDGATISASRASKSA